MGDRGGACISCMMHAPALRSGTFRPLGARGRDLSCMFHGCFKQVTSGAGNTRSPESRSAWVCAVIGLMLSSPSLFETFPESPPLCMCTTVPQQFDYSSRLPHRHGREMTRRYLDMSHDKVMPRKRPSMAALRVRIVASDHHCSFSS